MVLSGILGIYIYFSFKSVNIPRYLTVIFGKTMEIFIIGTLSWIPSNYSKSEHLPN
jgi:hypothetical protein